MYNGAFLKLQDVRTSTQMPVFLLEPLAKFLLALSGIACLHTMEKIQPKCQ